MPDCSITGRLSLRPCIIVIMACCATGMISGIRSDIPVITLARMATPGGNQLRTVGQKPGDQGCKDVCHRCANIGHRLFQPVKQGR